MSMQTPVGSLDITTPIKSFITLPEMTVEQYLLGINNIVQGDGAKITLGQLLASSINQDPDNLLEIGSDGKLKLAAGAVKSGQGWNTFPEISVNWSNKTVTGTGGDYLYEGITVQELSNFTSPIWADNADIQYLYFNLDTKETSWSTSKQDASNIVPLIEIFRFPQMISDDDDDIPTGGGIAGNLGPNAIATLVKSGWNGTTVVMPLWNVSGIPDTLINFLDTAYGTIVLNGGEISNINVGTVELVHPFVTQTTLGAASFNTVLDPLTTGSNYVQVFYNKVLKQPLMRVGRDAIVPTASTGNTMYYASTTGLAEVPENNYINVFLLGMASIGAENDAYRPYWWMLGEEVYETQAAAENANALNSQCYQALREYTTRFAPMYRFTLLQTATGYQVVSYSKIVSQAGEDLAAELDKISNEIKTITTNLSTVEANLDTLQQDVTGRIWVNTQQARVYYSAPQAAVTPLRIDLTSLFPQDGKQYTAVFQIYGDYNSNSGNAIYLDVQTDLMGKTGALNTKTSPGIHNCIATLPVGPERYLMLYFGGYPNPVYPKELLIQLSAYRRGT